MASITRNPTNTHDQKTLHYVYDPLCGWCYGIAPLIDIVNHDSSCPIKLHGGGLFTPARTVTGGQLWKDHVTPIDERISQLSGQLFSRQYQENLGNTEMTLNSLLPISAIIVAEELENRGVELLKALQIAYYQDGLNISDKQMLLFIAHKLGFDITLFSSLFKQVNETQVAQHLQQTQQLMSQVNGRGFPTLFIEENQTYHLIPIEKYIGDENGWRQFIKEAL
ncbi:DsbA family protein [Proteus myxofaciens]|uniref:Thioredoxin-like protein n=1 Tax=Proteus myxofaciens ATCC 19692 TaxID=1354337 RepID=A0A198FID8_9GAMM|nr:DsbA family protein [Proteus myxofaciens]OAT24687.1 thioredoxin-like protein [Proteus myxofaciens ATCC 19692]